MIVSVEGADLWFAARGEGPTCLVLTGIGSGPYEAQTPRALTDRFRLVYVELRGSSGSSTLGSTPRPCFGKPLQSRCS